MTNRSVKVGRDAIGSSIVTGDKNVVTTTYTKTTLPPADEVDLKSEIEALRDLFRELKSEDKDLLENALAEAELHLDKPEPNKDRIGQALERALDYAEKAEGFAEKVEKLVPHLKNACAWLGENWYKLLGVVGLAV